MSKSSKKTGAQWLAAVVVLGILATVSYLLLQDTDPKMPAVDLSAMEPKVAERIRGSRAAVGSEPENPDAWAELAQVFHAHDLFPQAIEAYVKAMALQPSDWRWPYLAALAQAKADPQASLPLFRQAIEGKPAGAAIYINYGDNLIRLGQHTDAEQAYNQALKADPDSSHALYGQAQVAMVSNDIEKAVTLLKRAKTIAPRHGEVYSLLAQAYQRLGDAEGASRESMFAKAWPDATRAPDPVVQAMESLAVDSQSIGQAGISLAQRGQYVEAEAKFREVLAIRPGNARDYANLGGALAGQGKAEDALAAYRKGLEIDPTDVDTLNNLGFTLMQQQRPDEAEKHLQQALQIDPTFAPALGNLGLLAERRQQPEKAIDYLKQALDLNPGLLFARNALATQLVTAGDTSAAIEQWTQVLAINPNELAAIYNIAMTRVGRGEHAPAIEYLRKGLAIAPNSSRLVIALAWELATAPEYELRDGDEAMQLAQRVYSAYPNQARIIDVMAAALAETGDFDNAIKLMERLVDAGGDASQPYVARLKMYRRGQPWRQVQSTSISVPVSETER